VGGRGSQSGWARVGGHEGGARVLWSHGGLVQLRATLVLVGIRLSGLVLMGLGLVALVLVGSGAGLVLVGRRGCDCLVMEFDFESLLDFGWRVS